MSTTPTPEEDAEALKTAFKGIGTDEAAVIKIVANRTNAHRQKIKEAFQQKFSKDLVKELKSELSGKFEDAVVALFEEPITYDVKELESAMKGLGTDEDLLIEILGSRSNAELTKIKEQYNVLHKKDLIERVKDELKNEKELRTLMEAILQCNRSENTNPNEEECQNKAKEIFDIGEAKWKDDENIYCKLFASSSPHEFCCISKHYYKLSGHTILDAVNNEFKGDMKKLLSTILYAHICPAEYFARRIYESMKGAGTRDKMLIRNIVFRDEIDMPLIKRYYKQLFNKDMIEDIKSDCSGDYKKLLVEVVSH